MKAVDIVTIEKLIPIYKNGEPANAIEVARVKDSEGSSIQYDIVVGKGLHQVGGRGIYIQPDYTIPMNKLFLEYHAPFGDPKNSKLGKKGRVRAIKFNLNFEGSEDPIYSYGVLLPWKEFVTWFTEELPKPDAFQGIVIPAAIGGVPNAGINILPDFEHPDFPFQQILGVEKYVADESGSGSSHSGLKKADRPSFLYKTDEETIENHKRTVDRCYVDKEEVMYTTKRDGQSVSVYTRIDPIEQVWVQGICSRDMEKKLDQMQVSAYKDGEVILHHYFHPELKIKGWFNDGTRTFYPEEEAAVLFEPVMTEVRDNWVDTCKRDNVLEKMLAYCQKYNVQLAMRGEIVGNGIQNKKNNYDSKLPEKKIIWFGVDDLSSGIARRIHYGQEHNLIKVCEELGFEYTKELFRGVFTYDEMVAKAKEYFKMAKETTGILVEGVVIRTIFSNNLSVKKISDEYDAKS